MQPKFRKVPHIAKNPSFLIRDMVEPYFPNPYHYHPEFELTAIMRGSGTRYIGDSVESFEAGDLILVGSNLAHLWKCDDIYYNDDTNLTARAIVIQFEKNYLGKDFWNIKEMELVEKLLCHSQKGIKIKGAKKKAEIKTQMENMLAQDPINQLTSLLSILNMISKTFEHNLLASSGFTNNHKASDKERINKVCSYVIDNFQNDISLSDVTDIIHMTPQGFCRFFKKETNKTFFSYLNDVRIGYACKLLINNSFSISQIAFESGFNTISYFNRKFKEVMDQTPSQYKTRFKLIED